MHKRAVKCLLCHFSFFPASLHFHQQSCFQKKEHAFVLLPCQKCGQSIHASVYLNHVASDCPGRMQTVEVSSHDRVSSEPIGTIQSDGRIHCRHCQRGFAPNRVHKHQSVCQGPTSPNRRKVKQEQRSQRLLCRKGPSSYCHHRSVPNLVHAETQMLPHRNHMTNFCFDDLAVRNHHNIACENKTRVKKYPYDMVLRERSNGGGFPSQSLSNLRPCFDHSNQTSPENPLARYIKTPR